MQRRRGLHAMERGVSEGFGAVVTGLGSVSAAGTGRVALEGALRRGAARLSEIDRSAGMHGERSARCAALVDPRALSGRIPPLEARRMSAPSRYAVVASRAALEDAGWEIPAEVDPRVCVAVATAFGPASFTQQLLDQILDEGPGAASPALFHECVANAPAGWVAITCRAAGSNQMIVQGETGPLLAVGRGATEVAAGKARAALVGAVEEINPLLHAVLDRFRALARPEGGQSEQARPFDRRRAGIVAAEGATILVLESESAAAQRGAPFLARVRAVWSAFDHTARPSEWGRGSSHLAAALVRGLARCGLSPRDIDLIVSGASGSREGDRLEASVLHRAWSGAPLPPVLAPKGTTGEYGGASLGAAVLAAVGLCGPTAGFEQVDPELGIRPHDGTELKPPRRLLVTALAAGGAAAWMVLERP